MLTKRPDRDPDVIGHNIRFVEVDGHIEVQYDLYYKRETKEEWEVPEDSNFNPPEWFKEGIDVVVWSVNRGTRRQPDYDWEYVMPVDKYFKSQQSTFTKDVRKKRFAKELKAIQKQLNDTINNYSDLFDEE